jgi:hypothetical protein
MTQSPVHRLFNLWHLLGVAAAVFALIGANKPELWQDGGLLDVGLSRFPTTLQIPAVAPNGTEGEGREGKGAEGAEEQGSKGAREQGSKGAREQGSKGAREQGSKGAREQGSKGAREQGSKGDTGIRYFRPFSPFRPFGGSRAKRRGFAAAGCANGCGRRKGSRDRGPCFRPSEGYFRTGPAGNPFRGKRPRVPVSRVPRVHVPKPPAPPSPRPSRERSQEQRRKNAPTLQRADTPTLHPDIARFLAAPPRMTGPHAPTSTSRAGRDGGDEG